MDYPRNKILVGDCIERMRQLPASIVQCTVTSPPYFALRSYLPADHPDKAKEIGSEPTPDAFIATMVAVFREVRRIMRDDGVLFMNLGDSYASAWPAPSTRRNIIGQPMKDGKRSSERPDRSFGMTEGGLMNIPHRVAEALRADGWNWRQTIIWAKKCLSGGTWLYARTAKGDAPAMLKDLVRLDPATVKLWDGSKWTQVVGWSKTPTTKGQKNRGYLELVLKSGERIGCTAEHRWPTTEGEKTAGELRPGDVLLSAVLPESEESKPMCLSDEDFGWLCGFYLAEGFKTEKGVVFSIHQNETIEVERIRRMAELMGGTASVQNSKGNGANVVVYSTALRQLLDEFISGSDSKNKRLDRKAWMRPNVFIAALLQGYLDGDGHRRTDTDEWRIGFCNNDGLAVDLRAVCARLGLSIRLNRAFHKCGEKRFPGWRGSIRFNGGRKQPDTTIKAIEASRARTFWDIEVADKPNWFCLASGVISHNSPMPESLSGPRWERCRVKVAHQSERAGQSYKSSTPDKGGKLNRDCIGGEWVGGAVFSPCPGCKKCIPNGGWVYRNGKGRCTTAHEYVFVFSKSERYFWDSEASKEAATSNRPDMRAKGVRTGTGYLQQDAIASNSIGQTSRAAPASNELSHLGCTERRNPRSVWTLSTEPTKEKHFATFPSELVRRCLVAGASAGGCCAHCGKPFAPMIERDRVATRPGVETKCYATGAHSPDSPYLDHSEIGNRDPQRHIAVTNCLGYRQACDCPADAPSKQIVFDPFSGLCTVQQTARQLGHDWLGTELNPEYAAIGTARIEQPPRWWIRQQEANKPKRAKAAPVNPQQLSLFERESV